jgi:alpha-N-arabinofuranosidase
MPLQATVTVEAGRPIGLVHPHLFGHFIEHLRDCIYNGLWAEMLQNRKFGGHDTRHYGVLDPWLPIGQEHDAFFLHDNRTYYVPGMAGRGQSQRIEGPRAGALYGLAQEGLSLQAGRAYQGRIVLRAEGLSGPVEIGLGEPDHLARLVIPTVGPDWQTIPFQLIALQTTSNGRLQVTFRGPGTLWLGAASLMPADALHGWRRDVVDLARRLRPPIIRYPGGNFASGYHWLDGVGDRDRRPVRFDEAWRVFEPNDVGTDEFLTLCRLLGAEPYLCVNMGTGTPEEAAAWVEYCNGAPDSRYGALRAANGHPAPYNVRYWGLGNETYGNWQIGHVDAETYAHACREFARAMRAVDPQIKLLAVGATPDRWPCWNETVVRIAGDLIDYLTLHHYARDDQDTPPDVAYLMTVAAPEYLADLIAASRQAISAHAPAGRFIPIAFDEWNVVHRWGTTHGRQNYALADGLYAAGFFNLLLRQADHITMANQAQMVNVLGLIETSPTDCYGSAEYLAFLLYREHVGAQSLPVQVTSPTFEAPAVGNMPARSHVPWLDAAATFDPAGHRLVLHLVNRHPTDPIETTLDVCGLRLGDSATLYILTGPDVWARNTFANKHHLTITTETQPLGPAPHRLLVPARSAVAVNIPAH